MVIVRLAALTGLAFLAALVDAHALTDLECSKKFQEAVNAGTTHGLTWTQFKKSEYGPGAKPVAEPIEALKDELKKDGSSEENIQSVFIMLHLALIARQCIDDGYEDPKLGDAMRKIVANSGVKMSDSQVNTYYSIDLTPSLEILSYKGMSNDERYAFCMAKRRDFAAFGLL